MSLSTYEQERLDRIAANNARLAQLGLVEQARAFNALARSRDQIPGYLRQPRNKRDPNAQPRRSGRKRVAVATMAAASGIGRDAAAPARQHAGIGLTLHQARKGPSRLAAGAAAAAGAKRL